MTILQTSSLGKVEGKTADGVTEFLGIKYATLENRFAEPQIAEPSSTDTLDATSHGPASMQQPFGPSVEFGHAQHSLPFGDFERSDVDCLNLNITLPEGYTSSSKLPVLVFIHGGGYFLGASSWPQYRLDRFVRLSVEKKVPTVVVTINYRLGTPGFLTSEELRNAGFKPNNGLRDQRVALLWIRKYIHEFGGDPENITVAGQSAGAASVVYHLNSQEPLFKRAIPFSGTSPLMKGLSYEVHEGIYKQAIEGLGLADASAEDRIKALLNMPADEYLSKLPMSVQIAPAIDHEIVLPGVAQSVLENLGPDSIPGQKWCQDLLIGDNEADSSIIGMMAPHIEDKPAERFIAAVNKALASYPEVAKEILQVYKITKDTPDDVALESVYNFCNDIRFNAPALNLAKGWNGKAYVYYLNEGNPWEGPWKGRANHILDVFLLFQNFTEFLSEEQKQVGVAFAHDVLKFCHGTDPWPAITTGQIETGFAARVYGPSQSGSIARVTGSAFGGETRRRSIFFDSAAKVTWGTILQIFTELTSP